MEEFVIHGPCPFASLCLGRFRILYDFNSWGGSISHVLILVESYPSRGFLLVNIFLAHTSSLHALSLYFIILYKRFVFGHICIIRAQNLLLCRVLDILTRIQISSLVYCKFLYFSTFRTLYVELFF